MTTEEFSREFDILYNNITSNQAPPLNTYEKSVFLTEALYVIVRSLYNGTLGRGFEMTEDITSYLTGLVKECTFLGENASNNFFQGGEHLASTDTKMLSFILPSDVWWIVYESANVTIGDRPTCYTNYGKKVSVVPVTHDTLDRTLEDPFRRPNERKVLRLSIGDTDIGTQSIRRVSNLILREGDDLKNYLVRYVRKPKPIIIEDLQSGDYPAEWGLTICGISGKTECELPDSVHDMILSSAVQLADKAWKATGAVSQAKQTE